MTERIPIRFGAVALAGLLVLSACGGTATSPPASRAPATSAPAASSAPAATSAAPATSAPAETTEAPASSAPAATSAAPETSAPAETSAAPETSAPAETSAAPESSAPAGSMAPIDPSLSGSIVISGSSTVEPISTRVKELFNEQAPNVAISVDGPGTGDGFELFCAGETDISDASRAIEEDEIAACAEAGVEYVELKVAIDGLSVITSVNNADVECLTFNDLYALIGPESTGFENWSDAQELATELGSTTTFPDAPLTITAPGEESGTYDSFVELVITPVAETRLEAGAITEDQVETTRPDYQASPNDNVIIDGVAGTAENASTLGWVGFAFVEENLDRVKPLQIDNGETGCVEPTAETIASADYPIARDLFIYVNKAKAAENPALVAYVDFYLAEGTIASVLETVPYVPLSPEAFAETTAAWEAR